MNIISKSAAMKIHRQHTDSRLARYCRGKYKWLGHSRGREVTEGNPPIFNRADK